MSNAAACGDRGLDLVFKEGEGSISLLEQAALDFRWAICAGEGYEHISDRSYHSDPAHREPEHGAHLMTDRNRRRATAT